MRVTKPNIQLSKKLIQRAFDSYLVGRNQIAVLQKKYPDF